mmetsp:Transcript_29535/g.95300  ORF Transcript_29535/g.95300 Transcript_29535/m.95300 type:complete len:213 (-) Transcript_29535:857-1495(-)|eukprot:scaffold7832_cov106-Isochrysis_galbana.AAC.2
MEQQSRAALRHTELNTRTPDSESSSHRAPRIGAHVAMDLGRLAAGAVRPYHDLGNDPELCIATCAGRLTNYSSLPWASASGAFAMSCSGSTVLARQPVSSIIPPNMEAGASISPRSSVAKPAAQSGSVATMTEESAAGSLPRARVWRTTVSAVETRPVYATPASSSVGTRLAPDATLARSPSSPARLWSDTASYPNQPIAMAALEMSWRAAS